MTEKLKRTRRPRFFVYLYYDGRGGKCTVQYFEALEAAKTRVPWQDCLLSRSELFWNRTSISSRRVKAWYYPNPHLWYPPDDTHEWYRFNPRKWYFDEDYYDCPFPDLYIQTILDVEGLLVADVYSRIIEQVAEDNKEEQWQHQLLMKTKWCFCYPKTSKIFRRID